MVWQYISSQDDVVGVYSRYRVLAELVHRSSAASESLFDEVAHISQAHVAAPCYVRLHVVQKLRRERESAGGGKGGGGKVLLQVPKHAIPDKFANKCAIFQARAAAWLCVGAAACVCLARATDMARCSDHSNLCLPV